MVAGNMIYRGLMHILSACRIQRDHGQGLVLILGVVVDHKVSGSSPAVALMSFGKTLIYICHTQPRWCKRVPGRKLIPWNAWAPYHDSSATAGVIIWYLVLSAVEYIHIVAALYKLTYYCLILLHWPLS